MLKVYAYSGCSTCRKALKFLDEQGVKHRVVPIRETPPSSAELRRALRSLGDVKKLFNVSGQDYRALGIKERLPKLSQAEAIELLGSNGNLVKRPFSVDESGLVLVGFRPEAWEEALG